jgi:transcription elongation factor/antiterminator RfaH
MFDFVLPMDGELAPCIASAGRWYVVCAHPHKEATACGHLERQGYRTFLPQIRRDVRGQRRVRQVLRPLFPRYLFVSLDIEKQGWRRIRSTIGVSSLVMDGDRPRPVVPGLVEELAWRTAQGDGVSVSAGLSVGDTVRFVGGPFRDRIGALLALKDSERAVVLLSLLGGTREVAVAVDQLQPVAAQA